MIKGLVKDPHAIQTRMTHTAKNVKEVCCCYSIVHILEVCYVARAINRSGS